MTNPASHDKLLPLRYIIAEYVRASAQIAQLVEQRTENPRVTGSIPVLGTVLRYKPSTSAGVVQW